MIPGPERYILEDDLNCGPGESGIIIMDVDDGHIDCQDNKIFGDKEDPGELGIGVAGDHITIANCNVQNSFSASLPMDSIRLSRHVDRFD